MEILNLQLVGQKYGWDPRLSASIRSQGSLVGSG